MILGTLALCVVLPVLAALAYAAMAKPAGAPACAQCQDGQSALDLPLAGRRGARLALRCPGCGAAYAANISALAVRPLAEEELRRDFGERSSA